MLFSDLLNSLKGSSALEGAKKDIEDIKKELERLDNELNDLAKDDELTSSNLNKFMRGELSSS